MARARPPRCGVSPASFRPRTAPCASAVTTSSAIAIAAKQQLAFFTDEPRLFDYLTVWQHLNFVARIYQVADYEKIGRELLEELEIANKRMRCPANYPAA
jgi:ABC-type multidrug transport system ATPase subunit